MSPRGLWLPVILAALAMLGQCHHGRKPDAGPNAPTTLTVLLQGAPDGQVLCRAAEAVEKSLAGEAFVKSLAVSGHAEEELVMEVDPDKMHAVGVDMAAIAAAVRQGLPAVPEEDMAVDEEKKTVAITLRECAKLDLDADQIMNITVKDPMGNSIPLGSLAVLKIRAKSRGLLHEGGRALKLEVSLADAARYEEARKSLERTLAESLDASLLTWEMF